MEHVQREASRQSQRRQGPCPVGTRDPLIRAVTTGDFQEYRSLVERRSSHFPRCTKLLGLDERYDPYWTDLDEQSPRYSKAAQLFENQAAWDAYQQLPESFREAIWLFDVELCDAMAAGAALSLPSTATLPLYRRARNAFRLEYLRARRLR